MKKPNYTDFKGTSGIYELASQIINSFFKNKEGLKNISFSASDFMSKDNLFFSILQRLINSNFKISNSELNNIVDSYLTSVSKLRSDNSFDDGVSSFSEDMIFTNKVLNYKIDSEHEEL
jgi:hypothetical protein